MLGQALDDVTLALVPKEVERWMALTTLKVLRIALLSAFAPSKVVSHGAAYGSSLPTSEEVAVPRALFD